MTDRPSLRVPVLATFLPAILLAGCGQATTLLNEPASVAVVISGPSVTVGGPALPMLVTTVRELTAQVSGTSNDTVVWSLAEGATAGTITQTGRYTSGSTAGTWHVVAKAKADSNAVDTMAITVVGLGTTSSLGVAGYGVAVNGNERVGVATNATKVRFVNGGAGDSVTTNGTPVHVVYDTSGTLAYVTLQSGNALVKLQVSPAAELTRVAYGHSLYNLIAHPNGSAVYVTTSDGWLFKANPSTLAKQDSVHLASASNGLAFTSNASRLYVSTISAGVVYAINPSTLAKIDSFVVGAGAQRLAVAPSGDSVYVANETAGALNVIRPSTHTVTSLSIAGTPYGVALSADGAALYVALRTSGKVRVLRRPGLDSLGTLTVGGTPRNVAAAPDGTFMVVSTQTDVVKIQ